jgi:hypothetical protein
VRDAIGLEANERVVALVHLGPLVSDPPEKERAPIAEVLRFIP